MSATPPELTPTLDSAAFPDWVAALRRYILALGAGNLIWETLHLPLYTIWQSGTTNEKLFAIFHCTGGDLLIGVSSLLLALCLVGNRGWPVRRFWPVALLTVIFGVGYAIFSEWLNIVIRASWAYADSMPVVPWLGTGLSPLLQWIVMPLGGLALARRQARAPSTLPEAER